MRDAGVTVHVHDFKFIKIVKILKRFLYIFESVPLLSKVALNIQEDLRRQRKVRIFGVYKNVTVTDFEFF